MNKLDKHEYFDIYVEEGEYHSYWCNEPNCVVERIIPNSGIHKKLIQISKDGIPDGKYFVRIHNYDTVLDQSFERPLCMVKVVYNDYLLIVWFPQIHQFRHTIM